MTDKKNSASRAQSRKDEMRAMAGQAAANAPGIEDRINQAKGLIDSHPLRSEQSPAGGASFHASVPDLLVKTPAPGPGASGAQVPFHIASPRGYYELVPVSQIFENPFNARKTYREVRIREMKASIAANGQETPGTATIRDGKYVLAAGHYRLKALQHLDAPYMGLMIIPELSDKALYEISYRENAEREDQSAFDNALAWRSLLDTKVYSTEQEVADAVSLSASNVNKTLGILRLSASIQELVAEDPTRYPLSVLYELALFEPVGGGDRTLALAKAVASGDIGRQQIQDARAQLQDKKPRKGRETSRQYKIKVAGTSEGTLKEWTSGKVAFEVQIEDPVARAKFVAEMRERFESTE
jgi:ParB family chromosome partitioning protein